MNTLDTFLRDLFYTIRTLRKSPGFAVVAIGTFALGIGANTAIFTIVNAVLLQPLPYAEPQQLVLFWQHAANPANRTSFSLPRFEMLRDQSKELGVDLAAYAEESVTLASGQEPARVQAARISANFLPLLGVPPALGRTFSTLEDSPAGSPVVILSDTLWRRRFSADRSILGKSIAVDGQSRAVVGILPAGFRFSGQSPDLWIPRVFDTSIFSEAIIRRGATFLTVIGRLQPDVSMTQAAANLQVLSGRYVKDHRGNTDATFFPALGSLHEETVSDARTMLGVLWAAVGCVLLIACANVANLLLARGAAREKEITVRIAVGASRSHIISQLVTESLFIAMCGGLLGLPLADWGVRMLLLLDPANLVPVGEVHADATVLLFTFAVSLIIGVLFGLAPAILSARADVQQGLQASSRGTSGKISSRRLRSALIIAEVAVSLVLLVGAGLLMQSFSRMRGMSTGAQPAHVLTMQLALPPTSYQKPEARAAFYDHLLQRVQALPGVVAAGAASRLHITQSAVAYLFRLDGAPDLGPKNPAARARIVSDGYFRALGIPLLRGRGFDAHDNASALPVMIVNESFARRYFPGKNAIGERVVYSTDRIRCQIVGIVGDVRASLSDLQSREEMYVPYTQKPWLTMTLAVRYAGDPQTIVPAIQAELHAIDKGQALSRIQTMEQAMAETLNQPRTTATVVLAFAFAALALAALGLYGVMAYTVTQRTREMGIRMALGARPAEVRNLIVRQSMKLVAAGIAIGVPLAAVVARLYASLLFGTTAFDPLTFGVVVVIITLVAMLASYLPARRATAVDPMMVLRAE
jgi:putative ABC transport system permease protein